MLAAAFLAQKLSAAGANTYNTLTAGFQKLVIIYRWFP